MSQPIEVARRGQITIPKNLRDDFGIQEGQKYSIRALDGGVLVLTPQGGKATAALTQLHNALLGKGATLEEMLAELRQMRESNVE